jgi:hypothetical protein
MMGPTCLDPRCRADVNHLRPCPLPQQPLVQGDLRPQDAYLSPGIVQASYAESRFELNAVAVRISICRFWRPVIGHPWPTVRSGSKLLLASALFAVRRAASHSVGVDKLLKRALLVKKPSSLSIPAPEGCPKVFPTRRSFRAISCAVIWQFVFVPSHGWTNWPALA